MLFDCGVGAIILVSSADVDFGRGGSAAGVMVMRASGPVLHRADRTGDDTCGRARSGLADDLLPHRIPDGWSTVIGTYPPIVVP